MVWFWLEDAKIELPTLQENINFFMLSLSIEIFILRIFIISHYVYKEPLMKNVLCFCFMFFVWKIEPVLSKNITFFRQKLCQKTNVSCPFSWKKQKTFRCKSPLKEAISPCFTQRESLSEGRANRKVKQTEVEVSRLLLYKKFFSPIQNPFRRFYLPTRNPRSCDV